MDLFSCLCSLLCLGAVWAELQLSVVSPKTAILGSDTLLECTFTVDMSHVDLQYLEIIWRFQGKDLLSFSDTLNVFDSRASIDETKITDGNASLKLSELKTSHEGEYTCSVIYIPVRKDKTITVNLQAHPRIIIQEPAVIIGKENLLRCSVVGFYPMEIYVFWSRDGQILPGSSMSQHQRHSNGTFMVNSTVPIIPTDNDANHTFSCHVHHSSLEGPLQKDVRLLLQEEARSVSVTVVVLSLLAIVVIMAVLGWFLYRRLAHRELTLCEIQGPVTWMVGETVELICVGNYYPKDIKITWIKLHKGKETEIEAWTSPTKDEVQPLLSMKRYRTESSKAAGNLTLTSILFIMPSLEEDEEAVFKCRFFTSDDKVKEEKEFKGFKLYGKPQVDGNIACVPCDGMNVQCTLDLKHFYPEEIQIKWSSGSGKLENASTKECETENADRRTFNVRTECIIPEEAFNDGNFKIRVTWEHASLKAPEYREMSVTDPDFPGRPLLEGIVVPLLIHGCEASLQCRVAEYFPKKLHMQWLKVEKTSDGHYRQHAVGNEVAPQPEGGYVLVTPSGGIYPPLSQLHGSAALLLQSIERDDVLQRNESARHVLQSDRGDGSVPQSSRKNGHPLQPQGSDRHLHQSDGPATISNGIDEPIAKRNESDGHPPQSDGNERVNQINTRDDHVPQSDGPVTISSGIYGFVPPSEDISVPPLEFDASETLLPPSDESDEDVPQSNESERPVPQSDERDGLVYRSNNDQVNQLNARVGIVPQSNASDWLVSQTNGSEGQNPQSNGRDKRVNQINASDGLGPHFNRGDGHEPQFEGPVTTFNVINGSDPQYKGSDGAVSPSDGSFMPAVLSNENGVPVRLSNACASLDHDLSSYKSTCTILHHEPVKGYSCTACLTFTPDLRRDQGSTFICRVSHPSLKEALEKSTGTVTVLSEPKVSQMKIDSSALDGTRTLLLVVFGFYPGKVTVLWTCDSPGGPAALPSELAITEEADGSYTAQSTCHLGREEREQIGEKHAVTVTVEHASRREPLKATISLKDKERKFEIVQMNFTWARKRRLPPTLNHKQYPSTAAGHLKAAFKGWLPVGGQHT